MENQEVMVVYKWTAKEGQADAIKGYLSGSGKSNGSQ